MKITKRQLRRIIKEEKQKLLNEGNPLSLENKIIGDLHAALRLAEARAGDERGTTASALVEMLREVLQDINKYMDQQRGF